MKIFYPDVEATISFGLDMGVGKERKVDKQTFSIFNWLVCLSTMQIMF